MKWAGVCPARRATRLAAGWIRCSRASKSSRRPDESGITISPSTTHRGGRFAVNASTSSGKYRVIGRSLRLPISTSSPSRKTIDRKPSHLGSKLNGPSGICGTGRASIGATGGLTGRCMTPSCLAGGPGGRPARPLGQISRQGQHAIN